MTKDILLRKFFYKNNKIIHNFKGCFYPFFSWAKFLHYYTQILHREIKTFELQFAIESPPQNITNRKYSLADTM